MSLKMKLTFSLRKKLILLTALSSTLPVLVVASFFFLKGGIISSIEQDTLIKLKSIHQAKIENVNRFYKQLANIIDHSASQPEIVENGHNIIQEFHKIAEVENFSKEIYQAEKEKVEIYFRNDFLQEYKKQNETEIDTQKITDQFSKETFILQSHYIANNKNPLGQKHLLKQSNGSSHYHQIHKKLQESLVSLVSTFGYYDVFITDLEGNIVYSVYKEADYATNLRNGPFSKSGLARLFEKLMKTEKNQVLLEDYSRYTPSYDGVAGFAGTALFQDGKKIGTFIIQVSLDEINNITLEKNNIYPSFETFMVGPDFLMRSDSMAEKKYHTVRNSFKFPDQGKIESINIKKALEGAKIELYGKDFLGRDSFILIDQIDVIGNKWAIESVVTQEELLAQVNQSKKIFSIVSIICLIASIVVGSLFATKISNKLQVIGDDFYANAMELKITSSSLVDISNLLSEGVTEQAAGMHETASTLNEISSMIQRSSEFAEGSKTISNQGLQSTDEGKDKVKNMLASIDNISSFNEHMVETLSNTNKEIEGMVVTIEQIAEKTKIINEIVFQTKLLSFNASVEAARAGEHGKGFAVVAEEVGNLANMSGNAATEISALLDKSVNLANQMVSNAKTEMNRMITMSKEKIREGEESSIACSEALNTIGENVEKMSTMAQEIANSSKEQSSGISEINRALLEINKATDQNNLVAKNSTDFSKRVKDQAEQIEVKAKEILDLISGNISEES